MKNCILLENFYLPGDLETQVAAFVDSCDHRRCHDRIPVILAAKD